MPLTSPRVPEHRAPNAHAPKGLRRRVLLRRTAHHREARGRCCPRHRAERPPQTARLYHRLPPRGSPRRSRCPRGGPSTFPATRTLRARRLSSLLRETDSLASAAQCQPVRLPSPRRETGPPGPTEALTSARAWRERSWPRAPAAGGNGGRVTTPTSPCRPGTGVLAPVCTRTGRPAPREPTAGRWSAARRARSRCAGSRLHFAVARASASAPATSFP